jgi:hypothetical protein
MGIGSATALVDIPLFGRSEASDAQTPSTGLVQNLNSDFNAVRVQAIMETIQHMAPDGYPLDMNGGS